MLASWSQDALLHEVMVAPVRSLVSLPDTQIVERRGWLQVITPSLRQGGLNQVALSALGEDEADSIIDATLLQYNRLGLHFRWCVGPFSSPADLAERLLHRGMRPIETRGMYCDTTVAVPPAEGDITMAQVDEGTVDEFTAVMAAGWNMDPVPLGVRHRLSLTNARDRCLMLLARYRGQPAGAAGLALCPRSACLMGAVVFPAFRGRGLYRALVGERLRYAAARGISLATTQAQERSSAPILEHMGFATACRFRMFTND